jgi:hypothetical protein
MLQTCVFKLSVSSNKYPLPITSFHTWSKHHNCRRMSSHVRLLSPGLGLVHIQQSALNRYWYALSFVPWDSISCQSEWLATASNTNILQHSTNMQHATHSKTVLFTICTTMACYKSHIVPLDETHLYCYMIYYTNNCVWVDVSSNDSDWMTLHTSVLNGCFPLWMRWCLFRVFCWLKT